MQFNLVWMRAGNVVASECFEELTEATRYANESLADVQVRFGATAVKVVDFDGRPLFLKAISR